MFYLVKYFIAPKTLIFTFFKFPFLKHNFFPNIFTSIFNLNTRKKLEIAKQLFHIIFRLIFLYLERFLERFRLGLKKSTSKCNTSLRPPPP